MPRLRLHVLVVDDDPGLREALEAALASEYIVHTAATGDEACALLSVYPVSAIILDAVLKNEHGLDLVERFRAFSPAPIAMLTGHGSEKLAMGAIRARIAEYLKKPARIEDLMATLARMTVRDSQEHPADHARHHLLDDPKRSRSTESMADHIGVSERHLRRVFTKTYGKSPRRYQTEMRMQKAAHLLVATRMTVEEIAHHLGYRNGLQLARVFKRAFGLTPTAYREQHPAPNYRNQH